MFALVRTVVVLNFGLALHIFKFFNQISYSGATFKNTIFNGCPN